MIQIKGDPDTANPGTLALRGVSKVFETSEVFTHALWLSLDLCG